MFYNDTDVLDRQKKPVEVCRKIVTQITELARPYFFKKTSFTQ